MNENIKVIVSLTSHTKERLANVPYFLFHSILKYQYDYVKVVLTLYKDDVQYIPSKLKELIDLDLVELIVAEENLRCHLKYFYAMKKYRDLPVITIDDDSIYPKEMIPDFLKNAEKYPNIIIGRSGVQIPKISKYKTYLNCKSVNHGVSKINKWNNIANKILNNLNLEGYGGILYPPDILKISDDLISEIKQFPRADDIYLYILERRLNCKMIVPKYTYNKLDINTKGFNAISNEKDNIDMIDNLIRKWCK